MYGLVRQARLLYASVRRFCVSAVGSAADFTRCREILHGAHKQKRFFRLEAKTAVSGSIEISGELPRLEQYFTPQEAADREEDGEAEEIPWKESEGYISLEYAYLYPPGSPVIVPGERISREAVELLRYYETQNLQIEGIQTEGKIKVWKHE